MAAAIEQTTTALPVYTSASFLRTVQRNVRRNPVGAAAGVICVLLILLAVFGPSVSPYEASSIDNGRLKDPTLAHPFGTDALNRDILSRIIVGARNSLGVAFAAIFVSTSVGIMLGISSGYVGGWLDQLVSRLMDVLISYPGIVFVIFFVVIFGQNFMAVALAIGIILVPGTTRIVRSATLGVKAQQFIEAAISIGNSPLRIMYRHVLPNVAAPIIVIASVQIGIAILIESGISFLGLGVSSAVSPSWGRMLGESRPSWQIAWWTMIFPGAAISFTVVAYNIFGDALRDWLDPRLRGTR